MSTSEAARVFSLDGEQGEDGSFERQKSAFRGSVAEAEAGRYHLYVCYACPWAHRTIIGRMLLGLEDVISMSPVHPFRDDRGWAFPGGEYTDPLNGFSFLSEAYDRTDPSFEGRWSVPVLWDKQEGRIVNNESGDIFRMLSDVFAPLGHGKVELVPDRLRAEMDALNDVLYEELNNAVYQAGFTTNQAIHEERVRTIFARLDALDERLGESRFLFGDTPVETDWRAFTTLVRFDAVYAVHFKCSLGRIAEYPNLWPYLRDLYQWPGIAETVRMDEFRLHYYGTHPEINPSGLLRSRPGWTGTRRPAARASARARSPARTCRAARRRGAARAPRRCG